MYNDTNLKRANLLWYILIILIKPLLSMGFIIPIKLANENTSTVSGTPDGYIYEQFAGNVFITKAADANLVLSFCSVPNKLYSLVLFKTHLVNESQLVTLHELVQRFDMPKPVDIKRYCQNTSQSLESQLSLLLLIPVMFFFVRGLSD